MANTPEPEFDSGATYFRLAVTWFQTALAATAMCALAMVAFWLLGLHLSIAAAILGLTALLPLVLWFYSGPLLKHLARCAPPDQENTDHIRLAAIFERVLPKTGLAVAVPFYISPLPIANAMASGRSPKHSFIACTEGLLHAGLTDDEIETVIAHELAHVKNRDTTITSLVAAMGSVFSLVLASAFPWLFHASFVKPEHSPLLKKLGRKANQKKRFFVTGGGVLAFVTMLMFYYVISTLTKLLTLFTGRVRESSADACAVLWTKNPCGLSMALQKIIAYEENNGGDLRLMALVRGMAPLFFLNTFDEEDDSELVESDSLFSRFRLRWRNIWRKHLPVAGRLEAIDKLSGGRCQRLRPEQ